MCSSIGRILAALKFKSINELSNLTVDFGKNIFWIKAEEFGSEYLKAKIHEISNNCAYNRIAEKVRAAQSESDYLSCIDELKKMSNSQRSNNLIEFCRNSITTLNKDNSNQKGSVASINKIEKKDGKLRLKIIIIVLCSVAVIAGIFALRNVMEKIIYESTNEELQDLMTEMRYSEAYDFINENKQYIDSYEKKRNYCIEEMVASYIDRGMFDEAENTISLVSSDQEKDNLSEYLKAAKYLNMGYYTSAAEHYDKISEFRDSKYLKEYALGWDYYNKYDYYNSAVCFHAAGTVRSSEELFDSVMQLLYDYCVDYWDYYDESDYDEFCMYWDYLASFDYKDSKEMSQKLKNNSPQYQSDNELNGIEGTYYLYPSKSRYLPFDTDSGEYSDEWVYGIDYMSAMIFNDASVVVSVNKESNTLTVGINRYNSPTDCDDIYSFDLGDVSSVYSDTFNRNTFRADNYEINFYEDGTITVNRKDCNMEWVFGRDKNHG